MNSKEGNGGIKRDHSNAIQGTDPVLVPEPAEHRGDDFGAKICPECEKHFEETNRSVLEPCMHVKCRLCFIRQANQCHQCIVESVADGERPKKALRRSLSSAPDTIMSMVRERGQQIAANKFPVAVRTLVGTPIVPMANSSHPAIQAPNHSIFDGSTSATDSCGNARRPPSPLMRVLPEVRRTYGNAAAVKNQNTVTPKTTPALSSSSRQAPYVNGGHTPAAPIPNGTASNFPSLISRPNKNDSVGKQPSTASTSASALNGQFRHDVSSKCSLAEPREDTGSESILGDLDLELPLDKENRVKKKKRNPVHIPEYITIVSGDPPLYQCNVCKKSFKTKSHWKYHEFCQNGEKPFKCEQCGKGFITKSHYEYHIRTHTGERPYLCPTCGKGFNQGSKVTRHMMSHTGEKPYPCTRCDRRFANAQALGCHFLFHTGERPFACEDCPKCFTCPTNLKKHIRTHTGERPFTCVDCGKSFGLKWTLDLHLKTHSKERPFACDQCTRAFSNKKDLRRHMLTHSDEWPFKCWICGNESRRKDNLNRHIKNVHKQTREVAKQLANEAAAEYMASKNSATSGSSTSTISKCETHLNSKPATVSNTTCTKVREATIATPVPTKAIPSSVGISTRSKSMSTPSPRPSSSPVALKSTMSSAENTQNNARPNIEGGMSVSNLPANITPAAIDATTVSSMPGPSQIAANTPTEDPATQAGPAANVDGVPGTMTMTGHSLTNALVIIIIIIVFIICFITAEFSPSTYPRFERDSDADLSGMFINCR